MTGGDNRIYRSDERMRLQYERMLLCAALRENRDQEVETLRRPRGEEEACAAVFEKSRAHMLARLNRRMLWRAFCEGMRRAAPRAARVTAAAAALLCVGLTAAFAASDAFRVQVYALFAQDYGEFTAIRAQAVPEKAFDVPTEWGGDYYPAYIPEGFEVMKIENAFDRIFSVEYRNEEDMWLFFDDDPVDMRMNIDTENANVYYTDIHGVQAIVSVKTQHVIIVWSENGRIFTIMLDGDDVETALKVARSVTRVQ